MAANNQVPYEVPAEMRDFAEKSVEQARKAIDGFMGAAQRTVETLEGSGTSVHANAKDATRKTFTYAEQNIAAAFDLAQIGLDQMVVDPGPGEFGGRIR